MVVPFPAARVNRMNNTALYRISYHSLNTEGNPAGRVKRFLKYLTKFFQGQGHGVFPQGMPLAIVGNP